MGLNHLKSQLKRVVRSALQREIGAVVVEFNNHSKASKLIPERIIEDVIAIEVIDSSDSPAKPYVAVIVTTKWGLRVRMEFRVNAENEEEEVEADLSIVSLHQSDCYCSCKE
jgi:hypothetical protein